MAANGGVALGYTVVIGKDCSSSDIAALTNRGVSHIGQVGNFGTVSDAGVLGFNKGADLAIFTQIGSRSQIRERPHGGSGSDDRQRCVSALNNCSGTNFGIQQSRVWPNDGAGFHQSGS